MKRFTLRSIFDFVFGLLALYLGFLILRGKGFATRLGDWVPLSNEGTLVLGIIVILCGLYPLYHGIKSLLGNRS